MKLSQFNFKLPAAQVALYPHKTKRVVKTASGERTFEITRRDESRLMVLHKKSETIEMYKKDENGKDMVDADGNPVFLQFKDIVNYFEEGDTFIFNDTKVFPARLYGTKEKTDAKIEVFLLRELNAEMRLWDVLVEPARKIRIGNKLFFDDVNEMVAEVIDNTTSTFTVTNGAKGDKGDNAYVWIRYAAQKPTAASHSFGVLPDNWMGVYSGNSATAPTDWTKYQWFEIKGEKGDTGNPATLNNSAISYQTSDSGTVVPSGTWSNTIPTVAQGKYLWTRVTLAFNTGNAVTFYSVSRMGLDGTGAVSKVCGKEPNSNGNVELEAENVGALPSAGGLMTGNIVMNSHQIKALGVPTDSADAATKGYVDTVAKTATLTTAGWSASAPYTQSVTVSGLTDTKRAMAYPVYGSNTATNLALKEACGMVSFASRSGSVMTFTCLEDKPTVDIPITVEVYV